MATDRAHGPGGPLTHDAGAPSATPHSTVNHRNGGASTRADPRELVGLATADSLAPRAVRPHIVLALCFALPMMACAGIWGATFNVGTVNSMMGNGGLEAVISPAFGAMAGCILFAWIVVSFRPLREPLDDYATVIPGAADTAVEVRARLRDTLQAYGPQGLRLDTRDVDDTPALVLRAATEHAAVTVNPIATDLLIAWSMWRRRSTARVIGQVIGDLLEPAKYSAAASAAASSALRLRAHLDFSVRTTFQ